jgi:hypothetical protein
MRHMPVDQLEHHLHRLREEADARQTRLRNLRLAAEQDQDASRRGHIKRVSLELNRLEALIEEGWRIYHERRERAEHS